MPEKDPFETVLVDCTALGAASITPLICEFSRNSGGKMHGRNSFSGFRIK